MKTKLTLNIDDKIVARAKRASAKRKVSLSSVVEEYLEKYAKNSSPSKYKKNESSFLNRIRKYTHPVEISDEEIERLKEEHMKEKYGL
jgi:isopropylmalate/homocitrate/citramalate synthase